MSAGGLILVADDDDAIRELMTLALTDEGYEVLTAVHGAQALELAAAHSPDLILMDMRMPVMSGHEFVSAYRELPSLPAPVVLLTAGRHVAELAGELRVAGYLSKPFGLDQLLDLVATTLHPRA